MVERLKLDDGCLGKVGWMHEMVGLVEKFVLLVRTAIFEARTQVTPSMCARDEVRGSSGTWVVVS